MPGLDGAACPSGGGGVQHQAAAALAGLKVVVFAGLDHQALARLKAHTVPAHFEFQRAFQPDQDLEMIVAVAARRCAVLADRQPVHRFSTSWACWSAW